MQKLVTSHACALGVPEEYIFFPLLSCVAGAMGRAEVQVNEEWREKCAIWCAVVGRRGSRRTATLNRFISAAAGLRKAHPGLDEVRHMITENGVPELFRDLQEDIHMNTIMHEDLEMVFDVLLKDSKVNLSRIKRLYDTNSTNNGPPTLNMAGFVAHEESQTFFTQQCGEITSRMLVTFPSNVMYYNKDLRVPMPSNTPSLSELFEVLWMRHSEPRVYNLQGPAKVIFNQYYDGYISALREMEPGDKWYCHVAKAPAQVARLSSLLCALRQALKYVVYHEDVTRGTWYFEIGQEDVEASKIIVDQALRTKFALMDDRAMNGQTETVAVAPKSEPHSQPPPAAPAPIPEPAPSKRQRLSTESPNLPPIKEPSLHSAHVHASHAQMNSTQDDRRVEATGHLPVASTAYQSPYQPASYAVSQQLNSLLRAAAMHRTQLAGTHGSLPEPLPSPQHSAHSQLAAHHQMNTARHDAYTAALSQPQPSQAHPEPVTSVSAQWSTAAGLSPAATAAGTCGTNSITGSGSTASSQDLTLPSQSATPELPPSSGVVSRPSNHPSTPSSTEGGSTSALDKSHDEGVRAFFYRNRAPGLPEGVDSSQRLWNSEQLPSAEQTVPSTSAAPTTQNNGFFNGPYQEPLPHDPFVSQKKKGGARSSMDQPLGLFDDDPKKFIEENGVKLKKLLEFRMDYRISPSTCAQRHLIPPLSRKEMLKYDTQTKYPVQVAKEFLLKVAQLGFGSIETVIHPANKRRSSFFQKYPMDQLVQEQRDILKKLNISEQDYMAAFMPNGGRDALYGFPFSQAGAVPSMVGMTPSQQYSMASPGQADGHAQHQNNDHMLMPNPKTEPLDMPESDESQL